LPASKLPSACELKNLVPASTLNQNLPLLIHKVAYKAGMYLLIFVALAQGGGSSSEQQAAHFLPGPDILSAHSWY